VLAIDAFYWGERRMVHETPPPYLRELLGDLKPEQPEYVIATNTYLADRIQTLHSWLSYVGTNWLGIVNHDDRRSIDLLESLPEVDRQRIGCAGLSIGGYRSTYLVGTDPRIRVAVITGWMTSLPTTLDMKGASHSGIMDGFGLHAHLDHPDVAALGAPDAAIFVQNCRRDGLFTLAGMQLAVEKIERVYQALNRRDFFRAELYDVPHSFDVKMQEDAFDWLDRHLRRAETK
jgi:dienelactone hydrolase